MSINVPVTMFIPKDLMSLRFLTKVLLGSLLIAISAQIAIPFWPVPMTMQTSAIMMIGLMASPAVAIASVIAYILEGALGLPVFQGFSSGVSRILGTTGGYIIGFVPMIYIISTLKDKSSKLPYRFAICLLGKAVLYIAGISYLSLFVGFNSAIQLGLIPFLMKIPASILFAILGVNLAKAAKKG